MYEHVVKRNTTRYTPDVGSRTIRPAPTLEEVKREIRAISESSTFSHSVRQTKLLEYICNKVLLGEAEHIKAATIAMEVFGRPWDFDETKDAIVRVEAHRLRRKLAKYYDEQGADDPLRIVLTPGKYIPEFQLNDVSAEQPMEPTAPSAPIHPKKFRLSLPVFSGTLLVVVAAAIAIWTVTHGRSQQVAAGTVRPQAAIPIAADPGREIRILAGRTTGTYVDRFGRTWIPDRYFAGGKAQPGPKDFFGRPPDAGLFATMRRGEFAYDVPVPAGNYELRLYWAEPIFRPAAEDNGGGENERRFNVSLNGKTVLSAFDVVADSRISPVDSCVQGRDSGAKDGLIHLRFTAELRHAFRQRVGGASGSAGAGLAIRIRAHDLSFIDHEGNVWEPDDYYVGGRLATHKPPVQGTSDPDLYAGERYGNFSYSIPVPSGKYAVTLYFAETWFHPDSTGEDKGGKGDRIFDVYCNGIALLKDLDIFGGGPFRAVTKPFTGLVRTARGNSPDLLTDEELRRGQSHRVTDEP